MDVKDIEENEIPKNFRELDIDNVRTVPGTKLVELFFDSMMEMKKIEFIKEAKHELSIDMGEPDFDLLSSKLDYKDENDERWRIKVLYVNEKEREYYDGEISYGLDKYEDEPETGGFVLCDSRLIEKPLGLVEIHHFGRRESRLYKNHTFPSLDNTYDHYAYFYYDYDAKVYIQVHTENLKQAKINIQKGKPFEPKKEEDKHIVMYLEREKIVKAGMGRLKRILEENKFRKKFYEFLIDHYEKETIIEKQNGTIVKGGTNRLSIQNIAGYTERYLIYLQTDFKKWMKIKFLIGKINRIEYEKIIGETQKLIEVQKDILQQFASLINYIEGTYNERAVFDFVNINWTEGQEIIENIKELLKKFTAFKTPKPSTVPTDDSSLLEGFIYDEEEHKLYPNAAEVERRRLRTKTFYSDAMYEEYQNEVLKRLEKRAQGNS